MNEVLSGFALSAMPFIDDALLWCPDNDGRIVGGLDIATCMQVSVDGLGGKQILISYLTSSSTLLAKNLLFNDWPLMVSCLTAN